MNTVRSCARSCVRRGHLRARTTLAMASNSGRDYDLLTIGGGSGGVRASRMSSQYGARVGLIEMPFDPISSNSTGGLGGTCVLRGCVPKKLMMYGSEFSAHFEDARGYGWDANVPPLDFKKLIENKDAEIQRLNGVYQRILDRNDVDSILGRGYIVDEHTVEVTSPEGEKRRYTADNILVATGAHAFKIDIPGKEHTITSDEIMCLSEQPKRLVVIGAGYIALEFASIFNGLGTQVDVIYRKSLPLNGFDGDMRETIKTALDGRGVRQHSQTNPTAIEKKKDDTYVVKTDQGHELEADAVMMATGRKPNTDRPDLGLGNVGAERAKDGSIVVDEYSRTNVPSIWAIGDVTNRMNLTPVAIMEGMALASTLFRDEQTAPDYNYVPSAVFTQPPLGSIGMTEEKAVDEGYTCDIYLEPVTPMRNTISGRQEKGLMKIIVEAKTDKVLGMHMVGPDAGEIMQGFAAALKAGATKSILNSTVGVHPSTAEEFVTMRTPSRRAPQ